MRIEIDKNGEGIIIPDADTTFVDVAICVENPMAYKEGWVAKIEKEEKTFDFARKFIKPCECGFGILYAKEASRRFIVRDEGCYEIHSTFSDRRFYFNFSSNKIRMFKDKNEVLEYLYGSELIDRKKEVEIEIDELTKFFGLPELHGTEKQVNWARNIRFMLIGTYLFLDWKIWDILANYNEATWWIMNRNMEVFNIQMAKKHGYAGSILADDIPF